MNIHAFTLASVAMIAPAFAGETWLHNIDTALQEAQKDNKSVLVEFTGSDWCPPCKALRSETLPSAEFKEIADKDLVLVELDFPQSKALDAKQTQYNQSMSEKYAIEGFPTVIVMNKAGHPYWMNVGYSGKDAFLKSLKEGLAKEGTFTAKFDAAEKATGMEKAKLLSEALEMVPAQLVSTCYAPEVKEIISLDKNDTLGYAAKAKQKEELNKQEEEFKEFLQKTLLPIINEADYEGVISKTEEYLKSHQLAPIAQQSIISQIIAPTYLQMGNFDKGLESLEKAKAIDPKSKIGEQLAPVIENIKANKDQIMQAAQKAAEAQKAKVDQK